MPVTADAIAIGYLFPAYMAVIVSSSVTKSGSTLAGNIPKMVIVKTNSGYASDPGHAGTGTIVATLCP